MNRTVLRLNSPELDVGELDPGIRDVVHWLRARGWQTTDSGDGATKLEGTTPEERQRLTCGSETEPVLILPFPHVVIRVEPAPRLVTDAVRLCSELSRFLIPRFAEPGDTVVGSLSDHGVDIEATFSPIDGIATIMLVFQDPAVSSGWGQLQKAREREGGQ